MSALQASLLFQNPSSSIHHYRNPTSLLRLSPSFSCNPKFKFHRLRLHSSIQDSRNPPNSQESKLPEPSNEASVADESASVENNASEGEGAVPQRNFPVFVLVAGFLRRWVSRVLFVEWWNKLPKEESIGRLLTEGGVAVKKAILLVFVFLAGFFAATRRWFSKLPFLEKEEKEKGIERLLAEADADPKNPAKQAALNAGLNKFLNRMIHSASLRKSFRSFGGMGVPGIEFGSAQKDEIKEVKPEKNVKTFKDVKGCDDARQELEEVVEYLKNPSKFTRLGGKLPKGILLTGAPGTGKTLLAKAIAGEAGVPFFYRAGSEFDEMFIGVGAQRVRSLFKAAKKKAPCIVFIDEIDAVGSTRKQWGEHSKKTLNQLLVEMDGFEQNEGIIVMAATNLPEILDRALTRPGRFDRHIVVSNPDVKGRQEILDLYLQDKPLADDIDVKTIARGTPGFNGADLANLVNIAAIKAAVEGVEKLSSSQLEYAKDRILMGMERKTMFVSEESKKMTAYHESGHAIVAFNTDGARPIHKATIIPRGSSLGMVTQLPSSDETSISKKQLLARLDVCMGGRVAEEMIFGPEHITTGASGDLRGATKLAHYMVSNCGMSDVIGPVYVKDRPSSKMQSRIDAEVGKLINEAYDRVKQLLKKQEKALHALASALLEHETLTAQDIKDILSPYQNGKETQDVIDTDREDEFAVQQEELDIS